MAPRSFNYSDPDVIRVVQDSYKRDVVQINDDPSMYESVRAEVHQKLLVQINTINKNQEKRIADNLFYKRIGMAAFVGLGGLVILSILSFIWIVRDWVSATRDVSKVMVGSFLLLIVSTFGLYIALMELCLPFFGCQFQA